MPRSIWSGAISFGLINVPVKLYSAVSRKTVRFHQLNRDTGVRIQQKRIDPTTGEEVAYDQIEEALAIADIVSVQNQLSLEYTAPIANGEVELCAERGIAFLPWSPLGGISKAADAAGAHDPVQEIAEAHGVSPQRVALAWLLALSPVVIPIPGASRPESIQDSVQAAGLQLSQDELQAIGRIAQAA